MMQRLRACFGILLGLLVFAILPEIIPLPRPNWADEFGGHPSSWTNGVPYTLERFENDLVCAVADPAWNIWQLIASFAVFSLVVRRRDGNPSSSETLCRKCGHILRGLSSPRCPECGESI